MQENIKVEDVKKLTGKVAEFQEYNGWTDPTFTRREREIYIQKSPYAVFEKELKELFEIKTKIKENTENKTMLLNLYGAEIVFLKIFLNNLKVYKDSYKSQEQNVRLNCEVDRLNMKNNLETRLKKVLDLKSAVIKSMDFEKIPTPEFNSTNKKGNFFGSFRQVLKLRRFLGSVVKQTVK